MGLNYIRKLSIGRVKKKKCLIPEFPKEGN